MIASGPVSAPFPIAPALGAGAVIEVVGAVASVVVSDVPALDVDVSATGVTEVGSTVGADVVGAVTGVPAWVGVEVVGVVVSVVVASGVPALDVDVSATGVVEAGSTADAEVVVFVGSVTGVPAWGVSVVGVGSPMSAVSSVSVLG